jgi:hypothetical protein
MNRRRDHDRRQQRDGRMAAVQPRFARELRVPSHRRDLVRTARTSGSPPAHSLASLLVLSKLGQLLVAGRDIQQIALVLGPGHLLGRSTYLFCALTPVLSIVMGGQVGLLQLLTLNDQRMRADACSIHLLV